MFILNSLLSIDTILGSPPFLFGVFILFLSLNTVILITLIRNSTYVQTARRSFIFLILILISNMIGNLSWLLKLTNILYWPNMDFRFYTFVLRIGWAFASVQYQSFAFFIESLVNPLGRPKIYHYIFLFGSSIFALFFFILSLVDFNYTKGSNRPAIEFFMLKTETFYLLCILMLFTLFIVIKKLKTEQLPRILTKQLKLLIGAVIIPYWISDFLQIFPFDFSPGWITNSYTFLSISNILLTFAIYYCSKRVVGLRFLNLRHRVQSTINFNVMNNFKTVLEQFSQATNVHELGHITQNFFKEAFQVQANRTSLYIRNLSMHNDSIFDGVGKTYSVVETFMSTHENSICAFIKNSKILIYDELDFSHFYEPTPETKMVLEFLQLIKADIFVPIYDKDKLIAYIIVDRFARLEQFYSDVEYDEMLVFASYLGNMINLLQNQHLETYIYQAKELKEELYRKHQEIHQYKESIRSFLRSTKSIGIIFCKNRRFTFGNQAAQELIKINPHVQEGHPLARTLKQLVHQVSTYKTPQTTLTKDTHGNTLVFSAVPSLEHNSIIIIVHYPEISDILKQQLDIIKDPSEWDYLLYLQTTKSGKLISQLIPGSGETLLNFKISLLKTALSKKATLLEMSDEDVSSMVELLHHIGLREQLNIIELNSPVTDYDIAIRLFGINPIFKLSSEKAPLLEQLNNIGTLCIKNIHFLDMQTQDHLAEFIRYGYFRSFKSDHKQPSNVRIICSTNQNLHYLAQEGKFSKTLFNELTQTTLSMPSLITLPASELNMLAEGFSEQVIQKDTHHNLLSLTDKDKHKLIEKRPASLQELKVKIQALLVTKSKENQIFHETQFNPAYDITDPELVQIARLGKQALKDPKIMTTLWYKFKNQNKIATFLGVNRSSITRRFKKFKLGLYHEKEDLS